MTSIDGSAISSSTLDDREPAGLAERLGLLAVEIGAGDELEGVERRRVLHVCAADDTAAHDPDFHATSPSMVMTAASERRAVLELGALRLVLLHDQPLRRRPRTAAGTMRS